MSVECGTGFTTGKNIAKKQNFITQERQLQGAKRVTISQPAQQRPCFPSMGWIPWDMGIFGEVLGGATSHTFFLPPKAWEQISAMYQCFFTTSSLFLTPFRFPFICIPLQPTVFFFSLLHFYYPLFELLLLEIFTIIYLCHDSSARVSWADGGLWR